VKNTQKERYKKEWRSCTYVQFFLCRRAKEEEETARCASLRRAVQCACAALVIPIDKAVFSSIPKKMRKCPQQTIYNFPQNPRITCISVAPPHPRNRQKHLRFRFFRRSSVALATAILRKIHKIPTSYLQLF
jgi:hypothetical protein